MNELQLINIVKKYKGEKYALNDFSLTLTNGVNGLLGPNGAGKSTLLKIIATITNPTSGEIKLNDTNILKKPNFIRTKLGYLPQDFGIYPHLNAYEFLEYVAAMKGISSKGLKSKITYLLEYMNLIHDAKKPLFTFSGGMKQRIGLIQAILNDPEVLILDEPAVGLDPTERLRFRELVSELAKDRLIILSSHIMADIEDIADKIIFLKKGKVICNKEPQELLKSLENKIYSIIIENHNLKNFKSSHNIVSCRHTLKGTKIRYITDIPIAGSIAQEPNLEDVYINFTN